MLRTRIHQRDVSDLVSVPLTRAITSGFAVYDTLFVELAFRENLRLATFDDEIIKTVPVLALRPPALSG